MLPMAPLMLRGLERAAARGTLVPTWPGSSTTMGSEGHVDIGDSPQIQRNLVANRIRGLPTS
jgi:hypothetical protein